MRFLILSFLLVISAETNAQIRSGSFKIDGDLNQINISANADFGKFRANISTEYNISHDRINHYHAELKMEPADIYFALEMSRVTGRSIEDVIRVYKVRKANGWGEIAKDLGIKPGSPEFHALKSNIGKKSGKYKKSKAPGNYNKEKGKDKGSKK